MKRRAVKGNRKVSVKLTRRRNKRGGRLTDSRGGDSGDRGKRVRIARTPSISPLCS